MRLGTGVGELTKYYKRKYYKYRMFDKRLGFQMPDYSVWDLVHRLETGSCYYCGGQDKLGLDRICNDEGHILNNTIVACHLCNMTKGKRFTVLEMKELGIVIKKIKQKRSKQCLE